MREFGVAGFRDCFIGIGPKGMHIMGLCSVYTMIMQKLGCWGIFSCLIMLICLSKLC